MSIQTAKSDKISTMHCSTNGVTPVNSYALVAYTPNPLKQFLDGLRRELVSTCRIQSHLTVLPPRPLASVEDAWNQLQRQLQDVPAFDVELGEIEVFPVTSVVYLSVCRGRQMIEQIHNELNVDHLAYEEPYPYHPHVTLAQSLEPHEVDRVVELAKRRWAEFRSSHTFCVETLTFVQNTVQDCWMDLAECHLTPAPILR